MSLVSKINSKWVRTFFLRVLVGLCVIYYFWIITILIIGKIDLLAALTSLQNVIITIVLYTGASALSGSPVIMPLVESLKTRIGGKGGKIDDVEQKEVKDSGEMVAVVGDQLSENFHISEFRCNDETDVPEVYRQNVLKLAHNLQVLRNHLNKSITITSGYRTPSHNRSVGGKEASKHLIAQASDIKIPEMTSREVYDTIESLISEGKMVQGGLGLYSTFVHYDVRGVYARWVG